MDMRHYKEWVKIGLNILYYRKDIQRIETGVSSCSLDTLMDIAKALDVPLYKLFEFKE